MHHRGGTWKIRVPTVRGEKSIKIHLVGASFGGPLPTPPLLFEINWHFQKTLARTASRFVSRRSPFHARVRSRCPFIALALRPSFILFSAATAHTKASSTLLILCSFFFSLFLSFFFLVVYRGNSSDKYFASRLFNNDGCATIRTR